MTTLRRPPARVSGAPPAQRRPPGQSRLARLASARLRLRTRPSRLLALAAVAVALVATLFAVTNSAIGDARDGLWVIGKQAGPQVVATTNLYISLSDMDTQLSNILLNGTTTKLGFSVDQSRSLYESDRQAADDAAIQALRLTGGNAEARDTARDLLDGMGQYEKLAAEAMQLNDQSGHPADVPPPEKVLSTHRDAANLMTQELLPKAYNLTLDSGSIVRRTYEQKRGAVLIGRWTVGLSGLAAVALLVLFQVYLSARFRRLLNPALALATLVCLAFTVAGVLLLQSEAGYLRQAKTRGFDPVVALSQARAISNSMNADESRYLLDPQSADTYDQLYLSKAQSILYVVDKFNPNALAVNLTSYDRQVNALLDPSGMPRAPFAGFLGLEAQRVTLPGQRTELGRVLAGYRQFQRSDAAVRALAEKRDRQGAVAYRLGDSENHTNVDFILYDLSMQRLIDIHRLTFTQAIDHGTRALAGWDTALPVAGLIVVALIVIGVRPRVAEYR